MSLHLPSSHYTGWVIILQRDCGRGRLKLRSHSLDDNAVNSAGSVAWSLLEPSHVAYGGWIHFVQVHPLYLQCTFRGKESRVPKRWLELCFVRSCLFCSNFTPECLHVLICRRESRMTRDIVLSVIKVFGNGNTGKWGILFMLGLFGPRFAFGGPS